MNRSLVHKRSQVTEVVPPLEQKVLTDHFEPRCYLDTALLTVAKQLSQLLLGDKGVGHHLVGIGRYVHVTLDQEDEVNLVLPPHLIRLCLVVDPSEELEGIERYLLKRDDTNSD